MIQKMYAYEYFGWSRWVSCAMMYSHARALSDLSSAYAVVGAGTRDGDGEAEAEVSLRCGAPLTYGGYCC